MVVGRVQLEQQNDVLWKMLCCGLSHEASPGMKMSSADGICVKDNINLLYLAEDW